MTYYQSEKLVDRIDWKKIMPMERYAGGHDEQMKGLLKDVTVIAHWNEGDYQGQVATCVQLNDTKEIVIYQDGYGSCSGCDAWEDATNEDIKDLCMDLARNAYVFKNIEDCKTFLITGDEEHSSEWEWSNQRIELLKAIESGTIME
jgi:hypothetical protein